MKGVFSLDKQTTLFPEKKPEKIVYGKKIFSLGYNLEVQVSLKHPFRTFLYRNNTLLFTAELADRVNKKIFVIEAIKHGANKSSLSKALGISRQTIHNYEKSLEHFGYEGLVRGYDINLSKSKVTQRKEYVKKNVLERGNTARQLEDIRRQERKEATIEREKQLTIDFAFYEGVKEIKADDQPFSEEHDWEPSRYAGTFIYFPILIRLWSWMRLVIGYYGERYQIFFIFLLMAANNIRSIEALKNERSREAGVVIGLKKLVCRPKVFELFHKASDLNHSASILYDFFRFQIRSGIVSTWFWFTDGHLLPYTGKEKVHYAFYTQRNMPYPGQTNQVTCDMTGRIIDFAIQEGKGDMRKHIIDLPHRWKEELKSVPIMVFDREGDGVDFFRKLIKDQTPFVTWEKNANKKELQELSEEQFTDAFSFNGKEYALFEKKKLCKYKPDPKSDEEEDSFKLRRIYIWNKSSKRRTSGLAWTGDLSVSTQECAKAILSRWGASENTFKHMKERHPIHYRPGFKTQKSENQEIKNPVIKEKDARIKKLTKEVSRLYKKQSKVKVVLNKNGEVRKNSSKETIAAKVVDLENKISALKQEKKDLPERIDVSSLENYKSFEKIDTEGKNIFDFVTSSVWNARKEMVDWLRPYFGCDNEVVDLFYAISYSHGWIKSTKSKVVVRLEPLEQPSRRSAQEHLCQKLTSLRAVLPNEKILIVEVGESPI